MSCHFFPLLSTPFLLIMAGNCAPPHLPPLHLPCSFVRIVVLLQIQIHSFIAFPQSPEQLSQLFNTDFGNSMFSPFGMANIGNWNGGQTTSTFPLHFNSFPINLKRKRGQPRAYNKEKETRMGTGTEMKESVELVTEVECTHTMFMGPFHDPVHFSLNSSIYTRMDKSCKWAFIGTEPCIPTISCDTSQLIRDCEEEFLEIVDGGLGSLKICGGNLEQVTNLSASANLRDLFVHFNVLNGANNDDSAGSSSLFNCSVLCSEKPHRTQLTKSFKPKLNPKCFCGTRPNEDRVVGGNAVKKSEYPWVVALVETNTRQPFCGASLINNRMVITAAHCIRGRFMDYRSIQMVTNGNEFDSNPVGSEQPRTYPLQELETMDKSNGSRRYNIDEIIIHELYVPDTNDFDVALLKLQEDIDFMAVTVADVVKDGSSADHLVPQPKPVCLPELGSYSRTYSNKMAIVAGWGLQGMNAEGSSQTLQKLEVKVFSPQACKETYYHRVNRRMMCAGHREGGRDACSGDSGGPLVVEEKPQVWTQVGAVSWGQGCGMAGNPGVYFRITEGLQWIHYKSNYNAWRVEDENDGATWCLTPP